MSVATTLAELETPRLERALLLATLGLYGVGDVATTTAIQLLGGFETSGFVRLFLAKWGLLGLVIHKSLFLLVPIGAWLLLRKAGDLLELPSSPFASAVLAIFAVVGLLVVAWNLYIIALLLAPGPTPVPTVPF